MKFGLTIPAFWKVRREIIRIGSQVDGLLQSKTGFGLGQSYQRVMIGQKRRLWTGALTIGNRVALYLIFPKDGVQGSHLIALGYLQRCGYTPVIVSNLPLGEADRETLLPHCALLLERPNFGYDFGGYQDGMRCLAPHLDRLDHLGIFNDSCWFPLHPEVNWLAEAEASAADFTGVSAHEGMPADRLIDFAVEPWALDASRDLFHVSSYALHFKGALLHAKAFADFWESYEPTNHKVQTILRGEIGLTQHILRAGYGYALTQDTARLDRLLDALPDARLAQLAGGLIHKDRPDLAAFKPTGGFDRTGLRNLILTTVAWQGPSYALADFDTVDRGGIFVKKAPIGWTEHAAKATLRLLSRFDSTEARAFKVEAQEIWADRAESVIQNDAERKARASFSKAAE